MGSVVSFRHKGNFSKARNYFEKLIEASRLKAMDKYGAQGVAALSAATPVDTGKTADSWYYKTSVSNGVYTITFCNSNMSKDWFPVAIMLDIGHGTGTGGWVEGRHYIDPAIQPIFDKIANEAWEEVRNL